MTSLSAAAHSPSAAASASQGSVIQRLAHRLQQESEEKKRALHRMVLHERQWLQAELQQIANNVNGNCGLDSPAADIDSLSNADGTKGDPESHQSDSGAKDRAKRKSSNASDVPSKRKPNADQGGIELPDDLNRLKKDQLLTELRKRGIHLPSKTLKKALVQALEEAIQEGYQEAKKRERARSKSKGGVGTPDKEQDRGKTDDTQTSISPRPNWTTSFVSASTPDQENLPPDDARHADLPPPSPSPVPVTQSSTDSSAEVSRSAEESSLSAAGTKTSLVLEIGRQERTFSSQVTKEKSKEEMQALIKQRMQERMSIHNDRRRSQVSLMAGLDPTELQQAQNSTFEPSATMAEALPSKSDQHTSKEAEQQCLTLAADSVPTDTVIKQESNPKTSPAVTTNVESLKTAQVLETESTVEPASKPTRDPVSASDAALPNKASPTNMAITQPAAGITKPSNLVQGLHSLTLLLDPRKQVGTTQQDTQAKVMEKSQKKAMTVIQRAEEAKKQQLLKEEERKKRKEALEKRKKERDNLKDKPASTSAALSSTSSVSTTSAAASGVSLSMFKGTSTAPSRLVAPTVSGTTSSNTELAPKSLGRGLLKWGSSKTTTESPPAIPAPSLATTTNPMVPTAPQSSPRESVSSFTKILEKSLPAQTAVPEDKASAPQPKTEAPQQLSERFLVISSKPPLNSSSPRAGPAPALADSSTSAGGKKAELPILSMPTAARSNASLSSKRLPSPAFMTSIPEDTPAPVEETGYAISDKESESGSEGSDGDDDRVPEKPIPDWARGQLLKDALDRQFGPNRLDPDSIFPQVFTCDLEEVFQMRKKRFNRRTSSANWTLDQLTLVEKRKYKETMGF